MELSGKIKVIFDTMTFDSGFRKREFVVTTQEQYPQDIKFELYQDKVSLMDHYQVGEDVVVAFNLRGNEYNGRYFVNVNAWKIDRAVANVSEGMPPVAPPPPTAPASPAVDMSSGGEEDDLPF